MQIYEKYLYLNEFLIFGVLGFWGKRMKSKAKISTYQLMQKQMNEIKQKSEKPFNETL